MQNRVTKKNIRSKMPPKGWKNARGVKSFREPPKPWYKKVLGAIFNLWTLTFCLIILLGCFLTITYFWFEFSDRIDQRLLSGEVFTPSAGIYSAPKTLKVGEKLTSEGLVDYLKSAGYIERSDKADRSRSRYAVEGDRVMIEPGLTGIIDGVKAFQTLAVKFSDDGKSVATISDTINTTNESEAKLEPRVLSSIAAEGDGRRKTVTFNDLPKHLTDAITVTEDRQFFEHYGVNFRGIARALWRRYEPSDNTALSNQGGSSITQQLVKNLLLTNDATLERKATEAFMSFIIETRLTKQEIFTLYANQIYLGQQSGVSIYGVGEASSVYFGKDVSQITIDEAAFLAGIIRSPNRYNPYKNPDRVKERRNQVLESMTEATVISPAQYQQLKDVPLELKKVSSRKDLQGMPYFSQYVTDTLPNVVNDPEAAQHLRVYTSIDPDLQRIAYEIVAKRLEKLEKSFPKKPKNSLNAALVAIKPKTGEIVAMIGGRDYLDSQFNRATMAQRQPGSVFKPFVYAAGINSAYDSSSRVFTTATVFKDEKKTFTFGNDSYAPNNYGDFFSGKETTFRDALVKSKNTITVDLGLQLNIGKVMNLAHKAGMPKVEKAYPSMALGTSEATPLEVATAYTMFANLGDRVLPTPITQVTAGNGNVVVTPTPDRKNVLRPDVAYIMNDIMKDIVNRGTAAQVQGWGFRNVAGKAGFAGKTGTSRDGWFAGFTPEIVCVVYVGFDDNDDLGMKGSDSAMPIWADFMKEALSLHPDWNGDWMMPANIRKAEIDIRNGGLIRELDNSAPSSPTPTPEASKTPTPDPDLAAWEPEPFDEMQQPKPVKDVPPEFRRAEIFIGGTVPSPYMFFDQTDDENILDEEKPAASPTPIQGTWQELTDGGVSKEADITISICPESGLRATKACPIKRSTSFVKGQEPKEVCDIHGGEP